MRFAFARPPTFPPLLLIFALSLPLVCTFPPHLSRFSRQSPGEKGVYTRPIVRLIPCPIPIHFDPPSGIPYLLASAWSWLPFFDVPSLHFWVLPPIPPPSPLQIAIAFPHMSSVVPPHPPPRLSHPIASATAQNRLLPPGANFSSHRPAFASKLALPPAGDVTVGHFPRPPPHPPQFVANNGPLIRAPDGQFVLASIVPQQHQTAAAFANGQIQQPKAFQFSALSNDSDQSPSSSTAEVPPSPPSDESTPTPPTTTETLPTSPPALPVDKSIDLDGDGALSLGEVQYAAFVHHGLSSSVVENLFNEVDRNKDNYLTSLEFNDIRPLVLAKAENAALRYLQNVDTDHNGQLSLTEAQNYILKEYGISNRDVERIWRLVVPSSGDEMDAVLFSKLRRRIRGMSIRLARQIMKGADRDEDGQVNLREAQLIAFEQEGIGPGEVMEMLASVDDNNDGQLNAPEFADFERIVRARAVETSKKALKVVDTDGNSALTMDEAKKIAFEHYGFDEVTLEPFFAQADENEDAQLDPVEFAGFRSVIRGRAVKNAGGILPEMDEDGDGMISESEAVQKARQEDDMSAAETHGLFVVADQDKNGLLDKVELADFIRLVRLTAIKFVADHFRDYDLNRDRLITLDELETLVKERYKLGPTVTRKHFDKADLDRSGDLNAGEVVDFRHEFRRFTQDKAAQKELEEQNRREMGLIKKETEEQQRNQEEEGEERDDDEGKSRDEQKQEVGAGQKGTGGAGAGQTNTDRVEAVQTKTAGNRTKTDQFGAGQTRTQGVEAEQEGPTSTTDDLSSPNATTQSLSKVSTPSSSSNLSPAAPQSLLPSFSSPTSGPSSPITSADPSPTDPSVLSPSPTASVHISPPSSAFPAESAPLHNLAPFPVQTPLQLLSSNVPIAATSPSPSSPSLPPPFPSSPSPPPSLPSPFPSSPPPPPSLPPPFPSSPPPPPSLPSPFPSSSLSSLLLPLLPSATKEEQPSQLTKSEKEKVKKQREEETDKRDRKSKRKDEAVAAPAAAISAAAAQQNQREAQQAESKAEEATTRAVGTMAEGEGKKRHKKRRRKTTVTTTTTTTTTEAPTAEEEGDDYEEEEEEEKRRK